MRTLESRIGAESQNETPEPTNAGGIGEWRRRVSDRKAVINYDNGQSESATAVSEVFAVALLHGPAGFPRANLSFSANRNSQGAPRTH